MGADEGVEAVFVGGEEVVAVEEVGEGGEGGFVAGGDAEGGFDFVAGAVGIGAEFAGVEGGGGGGEVEEHLEEADFPGVVDADEEGGEGVVLAEEVGADAVEDVGEGIVDGGDGEGFVADFEAVLDEGDVALVFAEPLDEGVGLFGGEAGFEGGFDEGGGGEDFGAEGLDAAFADADLAGGVHGLGEEVVADEGDAEGFEAAARGEDDAGVVDGVPEVEFSAGGLLHG